MYVCYSVQRMDTTCILFHRLATSLVKKTSSIRAKKLAYFQFNTMYAFVLLKVSFILYNCTLSMKNETTPSRVIVFMRSYPVESKCDKRF